VGWISPQGSHATHTKNQKRKKTERKVVREALTQGVKKQTVGQWLFVKKRKISLTKKREPKRHEGKKGVYLPRPERGKNNARRGGMESQQKEKTRREGWN